MGAHPQRSRAGGTFGHISGVQLEPSFRQLKTLSFGLAELEKKCKKTKHQREFGPIRPVLANRR